MWTYNQQSSVYQHFKVYVFILHSSHYGHLTLDRHETYKDVRLENCRLHTKQLHVHSAMKTLLKIVFLSRAAFDDHGINGTCVRKGRTFGERKYPYPRCIHDGI